MLGLSASGGIVVFEAKLGNNSYGPIASLLEGLDYRACLTSDSNFRRMQQELPGLKEELAKVLSHFREVAPDRSKLPEVIVLAPPDYYRKFSDTARGSGWKEMASTRSENAAVQFRMTVGDVDSDGFYERKSAVV